MELTEEEVEVTREKLQQLKVEHRALDEIIDRLDHDPGHDELQVRRLKKRKLVLKDQIKVLEHQLVPNILA